MIVGNTNLFAIESEIFQAYSNPSIKGLGFFVLHLLGKAYGKRTPDATALGCSYDSVCSRIEKKGLHKVAFLQNSDAPAIVTAFRKAIYFADQDNSLFFGIKHGKFCDLIFEKQVVWAPDGDSAFDDGSYVLQFDVGSKVRLIAFKATIDPLYDRSTLSEVWLPADEFYVVLRNWRRQFEDGWNEKLKMNSCANS